MKDTKPVSARNAITDIILKMTGEMEDTVSVVAYLVIIFNAITNYCHCFFITEEIPQSIRSYNYEAARLHKTRIDHIIRRVMLHQRE